MKIINLMLYSKKSASSYLRSVVPFEYMQNALGCENEFFDLDNSDRFKPEILKTADVLVLNREVPNIISEILIRFCSANNIKIIYELDDNIFEVFEEHPFVEFYNNFRKGLKSVLNKVDGVVVSTDRLKKRISCYNKNIFVYPNLLPLDLLKNQNFKDSKEKIVIGYAGALPHFKDTEDMFEVWDKLYSDFGDRIKFKIIGPIRRNLCSAIKSGVNVPTTLDNIVFAENNENGYKYKIDYINGNKDYIEYLKILSENKVDIAFSPLIDNEFNNCKSNIKYIEYELNGALGVYSRNTVYNKIPDEYIERVVDNSLLSWYIKVKNIINEIDVFYEKQKEHKKFVLQNYTLPSQKNKIIEYYNWLNNLEKKKCFNEENILKTRSEIGIIGAGGFGMFIYYILKAFGYSGISFLDNYKSGELIFDRKVLNIKDISEEKFDAVIIASHSYFKEIYNQIKNNNYEVISEILKS